MNKYSREQLIEMFGYSFQVLKAVSDLNKAISAEQNKAYSGIMGNYGKLKKVYNLSVLGFIAFCFLLGIIQGTILSLFEYIIWGAISYGVFQLLFSPIVLIVKAVYKHIAKKEFTNAANNDASNAYRQKGIELMKDEQFLAYKREIPETYFNMNDLYLLYSYLETYRADNFKEAANLLAEEKHRDKVEYSQEVMQKSLASIQANATYQSVIQTIHLLETQKLHRTVRIGVFGE